MESKSFLVNNLIGENMKNYAISRRTLLKGALFTAGSVMASPVIGQSSKTNSVVAVFQG